MKNVYRHWKQVKLGDLIETQKGFAFKSVWYCDSGRPIVKVSDFTQDSVDASSLTKIPHEIAEKYLRYELKEGDVVIQTVGSWPNNPASVVGKCIRVPRTAHKALLNQNAVRVSPSNIVGNRYLYYSLRSPQFGNYIVGTAQGAANQAAITLDAIRNYDLSIPPLPTQQKIAAILSSYDDLIENNLRRIKILEEMAQNLYREWFVKFRFPSHQHARFVDSDLGRIPEGWKVKRLDQVVLFQNNGTDAGEHLSDRVYLPIDCIPRKSLAISETYSWKDAQSSLHLFDIGDILFGAMRPYFHKVVVSPFKGVTRKTCFVFKSALPDYHAFAALTLFQDSTVSFANAHSKGATIPYAVWHQSMDGMLVVVPPIEHTKKFEQVVGPIISRIGTMYFQNTALRRTRDLLLPKLISGEIDVSELDIHTPENETNFPEDTPIVSCQVRTAHADPQPSSVRPTTSASSQEMRSRKVSTPVSEDTEDNTPPPIDQTDRSQVLQTIRQVFSDGEHRDRETAIRDIAAALGYRRAGNRIQEIIHTALLTAARRGILENTRGQLHMFARSIGEYERDFLKQQFLAAIGRTWIDRGEVIRVFCRWMGFARTGQLIDETARSLINGLLREGRIESDSQNSVRRI